MSEEFDAKACKHCVPLFIIEEQTEMIARDTDDSATLTFIKFQGRTYGITCKHVVKKLRTKNQETEFAYTFFIGLETHHVVQDRFIFPPADFVSPEPDIAIRELHPDFPAYIGKVALDIDARPVPPLSKVSFAVAVGFPDRLKKESPVPLGFQLTMPCLHVIAENQSPNGSSFTLYSELQSAPFTHDFSGMSGGPIYWRNEDMYGLLGVTYESFELLPPEESFFSSISIYIKGHLADRETIKSWVSHVPPRYTF